MNRKGSEALFSPAVWLPEKVEEAWQLKQQYGENACFIAGGTLLQTQWEKGIECPENLISLERIQELQGCTQEQISGQSVLRIGALTTIDFCRHQTKLFAEYPLLLEAARNIAAPAVRNRATIGGNVAHGLGDAIPALLVMDVSVSFFDGKNVQVTPLWDWLRAEKNNSNSLLTCIYVPETVRSATVAFYKKVGRREAFTPSIVTIAGTCRLNDQGEVAHICLAVGGGTTQPQRFVDSEQLLAGARFDQVDWKKVYQAIQAEFTPCSDAFATKEYKQIVAANSILSELTRLLEAEGGTL